MDVIVLLIYVWLFNVGNMVMVSNFVFGSYNVMVEDVNGCFVFIIVIVNELSVLIISVNEDLIVCEGDFVILIVIISGGIGVLNVVWMLGNLSGNFVQVMVNVMIIYMVIVIDSWGCFVFDVVMIIVDLVFIFGISGLMIICVEEIIIYIVIVVIGVIYIWLVDGFVIFVIGSGEIFDVVWGDIFGVYIVILMVSCGVCMEVYIMDVNVLGVVFVNVGFDQLVCQGGLV